MEELKRLHSEARIRTTARVVIVFIAAFFTWAESGRAQLFPIILLVGRFLFALLGNPARRQYRLAFKKAFVLGTLESAFTDLYYQPENGISGTTIATTNMVRPGSYVRAEDLVVARYRGLSFQLSDVLMQEKHGKTTKTTFNGQWMIFDLDKHFRTDLSIVQNGISCAKNRWNYVLDNSPLKRVSTSSEAFDREFRVYAQSGLDACNILTPVLMERIQGLAAHIQGRLMFCFVGNRLHVAIHSKRNFFEPGSIFEHFDLQAAVQRTQEEIGFVTRFIDELNGNSELFQPEE